MPSATAIMAAHNNNPNRLHPLLPQQEEEATFIPLFTVLKNNSILKNIFILNNNIHIHGQHQTLLIGRHPDCDIVLTHPSVSRFHLRITRPHPSSRVLSLFDLSSVHGTWVNGRKLEAGVSVDMKEGDAFAVGVSTRVYRLSWVPLTRALDSQNPSVFKLGATLSGNSEHEQVEMVKDVSCCIEEIRTADSIPECDNSLSQDENVKQTVGKENLLMEDTNSFCCDEERKSQFNDETPEVVNGPFETKTSYFRTRIDGENKPCECQNRALSPPYVQSVDHMEKIAACPEAEMPGETNLFCTLKEYLTENICLPVMEAVQGTYTANTQLPPRKQEDSMEEHCSSLLTNSDPASFDEKGVASVTVIPRESDFGCTLKDNDRIEDILSTGARIVNSENSSLLVEESIPVGKFQLIKISEGVELDSISDGEKLDRRCKEFKSNLRACLNEQGDSLDEIVEETGSSSAGHILPQVESLNSLVPPEAVLKTTSKKENQTLQSLIAVAGSCEVEIFENHLEATENAKYCHGQGNLLDQAVEVIGNKCSGSICPISYLVELEPVSSPVPLESVKTPQTVIAVTGCSEMEILESCIEATESDKCCHKQGLPLDEAVEYIGNKFLVSICPISLLAESVNSSVTREADLRISNKKENQTPQSFTAGTGCSEMEIPESYVEADKSHQEQGRSPDEIVQAMGNKCTGSIHPVESVNSPMPQEVVLKVTSEKENQTGKSSTFVNIWLTRDRAASSPQVQTRKSRIVSTSNVDTEVEMKNEKDIINKSIPKDIFSVLDDEEKVFTPNKDNFGPNMLQLQCMRKKGNLEEVKHSKSQRSLNSESKLSPNIYSDESINSIPNKENQAPKVVQERKSGRKPLECLINRAEKQGSTELKKNRVERVPFQSLTNSRGKHKSRTSGPVSAAKSIDASNCGRITDKHTKPSHISGEQKRTWDMVVDTATLLNKESRKALQLLQGLKGTRLIIPRLVIKELDSMRRQFRIFRRTSEASLALEWIDECMVNTKWWIHIQSSMEESRLIDPTPPASTWTQFIEKSWVFPGPKGSKEIAPPTVEDHILDFALLHRRKENNRQVVLLSDDLTLKIKSMAEGLLCETVLEFHRSLVNPFSGRFMWTNSSPRGLTWSCQDDVVLKEQYYGLPSKAGLKLITQQFLYSQA